jgi:thiol-disulfide isomerase/thioredoxin
MDRSGIELACAARSCIRQRELPDNGRHRLTVDDRRARDLCKHSDDSATMPRPFLPRRALIAAFAAAPALLVGRTLRAEPRAQRRSWPRGMATPALELPDLDGRPWRLADRRGRVVALNFWATWCQPCREEMPSLELMAQRHEAEGLDVIAVNFKEGGGMIRRFLEATPLDLPVLRDADGLVARSFGARVFPSTVFVGRDGRAAFTVVGAADWTAEPARTWVRALL